MPSGFSGVRREVEQSRARRESFSNLRFNYFSLKDGESAVVRFLEQGDEVVYAKCHSIPVAQRSFGDDVICLDQDDEGDPCPACESDKDAIKKRSFKGWINLIWRDGPVYATDDKGKIIKPLKITARKDGLFVWKSGITVFEQLDEVDGSYRGLMSRDFKITRKGGGLDTKYIIRPADVDGGAQQMSPTDLALAQKKIEPAKFVEPLSYDDFATKLGGGSGGGRPGGEAREDDPDDQGNVFLKKMTKSGFARG